MSVQTLTPTGMFQPVPYHHVSVASGKHLISIAGQINRDEHGDAVAPGDLAGQFAHALRHTARGLAGAGATFQDVVRLRVYIAQQSPTLYDDFMDGLDSVTEELGIPRPLPPLSVIGVSFLFEPDVLVEVEADAVLD